MKKYVAAVVCACLLLVLCLAPTWARAANPVTVYFTAVNETVLDLRSETMPFMSGGDVYVPYTVFDPNTTGINLGVYTLYGSNTVMVYSRTGGILVFDLLAGTTTTAEGELLPKTAIRRNSVVFLPVVQVCSYFGLDWGMPVDPDYGFIVRVKSSSSQVSDTDFARAAKYVLTPRYNAYVRSLTPEDPEPTPSTPAPSSPSPSPSPSHSIRPSPSVSQPPPVVQGPQGGTLYLAFSCGDGGDTEKIAAALAQQDIYSLFFFRPSELAARDDEVRALAAAGHKIGLLLDGADEAQREEQARYGGELLSHILRSNAGIALTAGGEAPPAGWFYWVTDVDGQALERSASQQLQQVVRQAVGPRECFLLLDDSGQTSGLLARLLGDLQEEGCQFRLALETVLPLQHGTLGEEDAGSQPAALFPQYDVG